MANQRGLRGVVQSRPFERPVCEWKAARLDYFERRAETGRYPYGCAKICGDVGLIEGKAQFKGSRG
jgi:hypothetical protein